jgi:hypothetical protein
VLPGSRDGSNARHGPLFDWFEDRFAMLNWTIPADHLGAGLPPKDMRPRTLLRFLLEDADYPQRDQIWAAVITGARRPATAEPYRLLAISLAARGLRRSRKRIILAHRDDTADIDHDLLCGFLKRMTTIDVRATNLGMKLIESGVTYAKGQQPGHPNELGTPENADHRRPWPNLWQAARPTRNSVSSSAIFWRRSPQPETRWPSGTSSC